MIAKKRLIIFIICFTVFGNLYAQIKEEKIDEYNIWLDTKKTIIDQIGEKFISISDIKEIEKECIKLVEDGLFLDIYVAFSNNTIIFGDPWIPPEDFVPIERPWYKLA